MTSSLSAANRYRIKGKQTITQQKKIAIQKDNNLFVSRNATFWQIYFTINNYKGFKSKRLHFDLQLT